MDTLTLVATANVLQRVEEALGYWQSARCAAPKRARRARRNALRAYRNCYRRIFLANGEALVLRTSVNEAAAKYRAWRTLPTHTFVRRLVDRQINCLRDQRAALLQLLSA